MSYCTTEGCASPADRDGVCFRHRLLSLRFNGMHVLKAQREAGVTSREIGREIVEGAKQDGREIGLVGKRWI